jgi:hypothetical protein
MAKAEIRRAPKENPGTSARAKVRDFKSNCNGHIVTREL